MPETAPDRHSPPTGTEVMTPGYHRRLLRRYSRRHRTAAMQSQAAPSGPMFKPVANVKPSFRNSTTEFLKRIIQYVRIAARLNERQQRQQTGQIIAQTAVKKAVKKL